VRARVMISTALGLLALVAASCGGDDDESPARDESGAPASVVTVNLKNWAVEPSASTLAAGTVKFSAMHEAEHGSMDAAGEEGAVHQLLVAPLPAGARAGQGEFGAPVLNLTGLKPGETKSADVQLAPGTYELACLTVEEVNGKTVNHYEKGMFTEVTVK
jgi:uncharacterized cupredoxin-like copper-binding protein